MTDIQVVSTHCVCHIEGVCQSHKDRIELTPWELQFLLIHPIQKGLLFHKPPPSSMIVNVIEHLKQSLSSTLNIFYPLAGRFVKVQNEDNTTHFFVNCTNAGVEFVHAVADGVTVSDILDPIYVPEIICSFFLQNGTLNYDGISKPLLAIQVTEFVDGFFIGCTLNHSIADGTILWKFFNTWSEISRTGCGGGDNPISQIPPIFERQQYFNGILNFPIEFSFPEPNPVEFQEPEKSNSFPLRQRVFHFSKEKIAQLKAKANSEMSTEKISSLQALLGHFWQCVTRNRSLDPNQEVKYKLLVGTRHRLELPPQYFGSAAIVRIVKTTAGELLKQGLGWASWEIHKVITSQTSVEVRRDLEDWVQFPVLPRVTDLVLHAGDSLATGSSPRFNVYGNDFGWGRPLAVRSGNGNKSGGKITVFEGEEEGSIQFEVCLSTETLQALEDDADFMATVSTR
ncbi:putative HXXXD-type acyl-transferase family protein [Quillaja saponaria]|uniref:HXXXD-type acyl-transferase family protein n=1 Tax=Quillaja saponaria TaxID=32244 RepID=A0AAD7L3S7_QUISA|nr:putative HXXXD-type acyl-transferase family protein [Quillaja saponaria]